MSRAGSDERFAALHRATRDLHAPVAVVDLAAFDANAHALVGRAGGKPVRLATKSLRCHALQRRALAVQGFSGLLAFTLPEALWLAEDVDDIVVGYPTSDRKALRQLAADPRLSSRVTVMVDSVEHLDMVEDAARAVGATSGVRVCLDVDASLEMLTGRVHLGVLRSPVRTPEQAVALARAVVDRPGLTLVGVMAYEAQIAGVGDNAPGSVPRRLAVRAMQRRSAAELRERRAAVVGAVRQIAPLEFVNGGGTGSVELTAGDGAVTEIAAGSGLYGPTLFDGYRVWTPEPAAFFALDVVRRPSAEVATVLGGGWIASGVPGADRLPVPVFPPGLRTTSSEGAGEVQTPLRGPGARGLQLGDRVWFRHAKAGELSERVNELHLVDGTENGDQVTVAPTYRGEGHAFL